jgi:hypothetical protein
VGEVETVEPAGNGGNDIPYESLFLRDQRTGSAQRRSTDRVAGPVGLQAGPVGLNGSRGARRTRRTRAGQKVLRAERRANQGRQA